MRAWGAASGDFERRLARQESPAVIDLHIEGETRRGHDFVRVYVVMTVVAPDVGQALVTGWRVFRKAAGDDIAGWDVATSLALAVNGIYVKPRDAVTCGDPWPC